MDDAYIHIFLQLGVWSMCVVCGVWVFHVGCGCRIRICVAFQPRRHAKVYRLLASSCPCRSLCSCLSLSMSWSLTIMWTRTRTRTRTRTHTHTRTRTHAHLCTHLCTQELRQKNRDLEIKQSRDNDELSRLRVLDCAFGCKLSKAQVLQQQQQQQQQQLLFLLWF